MAEVIEYKVGDLVSLQEGQKGKIVQIVKPLGTYSMYKVQSLFDGSIKTLAKHQLVKFEPLETNDVNDMHVLEEVQPQIDPVLLSLFETEIDDNYDDFNDQETGSHDPSEQHNVSAPNVDTGRFVPVDDTDVENFIHENENVNTRKKTLGHIKLVQSFLLTQGERRDIHNIPCSELDLHLSKFLISVRQKNGDEYQPSYLRGILGSLERHLKRHRYGSSIIAGTEFATTKEALKSKQKSLKRLGHGNRPNAADPLSDTDIET